MLVLPIIPLSPPEPAALLCVEAVALLPGLAGSGRSPAGLKELLAALLSAAGGLT